MITVVNEPQPEYKVSGWQIKPKQFSTDDNIRSIENETILYCPPRGSTLIMLSKKTKRKLSDLRGRMTIQSEKEIDDQISDLRSEWNRNI